MTKVGAFIHGIYPRSENLVEVSRGYDRGRSKLSDVKKVQKNDFSKLRTAQIQNRFDFFEDGKLPWQDIFRPFVSATIGLETGSLTRWFDNNSFYRQPIKTGKLKLKDKKLSDYFPKITPSTKWKVTLPSPFTFAKLLETKSPENFSNTLSQITDLLTQTLSYLEKKGVSFFQFNEPFIPYYKASGSELKLFINSLNTIAAKRKNAKLAIHFYFGSAGDVMTAINGKVDFDAIGVDFYHTDVLDLPKNLKHDIIAGIVEGRNSFLEREETVLNLTKKLIRKFKPSALYLTNNSDLELLPETIAAKKLKILGSIKRKLT